MPGRRTVGREVSEPHLIVLCADVVLGGGFDQGRSLFFDCEGVDGKITRVVMPAHHVSALLLKIIAFADLAFKDRVAHGLTSPPGSSTHEAPLINFQGIRVAGMADGSGVAIEVVIQDGVSMAFPVPAKLVRQLAESLLSQLAQLPRPSPDIH